MLVAVLVLYAILLFMPRSVAIEPSRSTTYIDSPLDEDGNVDFLGYLNESLSAGVTAENNAAVDLLAIAGPGDRDESAINDLSKMLKINPYQQVMPRFVPCPVDLSSSIYEATPEGVIENQDAAVFDWLNENRSAIDAIVRSLDKPKYYLPLLDSGEKPKLLTVRLEAIQDFRSFSLALHLSCLRHLQHGETDAAMSKAHALRQLAVDCAATPFFVAQLVALSINYRAISCERAIVTSGQLDSTALLGFANALLNAPPVCHLKRTINEGERLIAIDSTIDMARGEVDYGLRGTNAEDESHGAQPQGRIDWNLTLVEVNLWYDKLAKAYDSPDVAVQLQETLRVERDIERLQTQFGIWSLLMGHKQRSKVVGDLIVALMTPVPHIAIEGLVAQRTEQEVLAVGAALVAYRQKHDEYPDRLEQLAPDFLSRIPVDRFNADRPLQYSTDRTNFTLYSFGRNRTNDQGESSPKLPTPDDIAITSAEFEER